MSTFEDIIAVARANPARIVLSEGEDERVVAGALRAARDGIAAISIVARRDVFMALAKGDPAAGQIDVHDPADSPLLEGFAGEYLALREKKGATPEASLAAVKAPLGFAAMMVRTGLAEGTIGGAVHTTADTVRTAFQIIGKAPDAAIVSSLFLMALKEPHNRTVAFADCALVVEPSARELADIAVNTARSFRRFTGEAPRVAMLSFSSFGSAQHDTLKPVIEAVEIARLREPDLVIEGEIQFDAAFVPSVGRSKAPRSALKGEANVFVFPNLHAGNIGYKIAQRIGGATAIGPILQGLAKPANDLSRGCDEEDVYQLIAVTAAQAAGT